MDTWEGPEGVRLIEVSLCYNLGEPQCWESYCFWIILLTLSVTQSFQDTAFYTCTVYIIVMVAFACIFTSINLQISTCMYSLTHNSRQGILLKKTFHKELIETKILQKAVFSLYRLCSSSFRVERYRSVVHSHTHTHTHKLCFIS